MLKLKKWYLSSTLRNSWLKLRKKGKPLKRTGHELLIIFWTKLQHYFVILFISFVICENKNGLKLFIDGKRWLVANGKHWEMTKTNVLSKWNYQSRYSIWDDFSFQLHLFVWFYVWGKHLLQIWQTFPAEPLSVDWEVIKKTKKAKKKKKQW